MLRHSQFLASGAFGDCSNETIVGRSLRVEPGTTFISQLNYTTNIESVGATVQCVYDDGSNMMVVNTSTISLITGWKIYN